MDFLDKFKEFIISYKNNLIIGGILFLFIIISNVTIYITLNDKIVKETASSLNVEEIKVEEETKIEEVLLYKVDVKGAVNNPGVYELESDSRVIDAIDKAGGLREDADTSVNNLSRIITDEMVIVIYTNEQVTKFSETSIVEEKEEEQCIVYNNVISNDSCKDNFNSNDNISDNAEIDKKISINTATVDLLMTLPGIGEGKAKNIISYREEHGKFFSIEDIMNVSGIGEAVFEKIKDYITI